MTAPTETDETAAPANTAEDHQIQMVPEDGRDMPEGLDLDPAGVITASDPQSSDPAAPEHPGATDADSALAEPGVIGVSDAGSPPVVVSAPDMEPEPTRAAPVVGDGTSADAHWHEILTKFVDDPRSSVALAAGLVDDSAEALVTSVRERQQALLSDWQRDDAGTEEMRIALQQYRTFWNRIEIFSRES
jgi:hypothetical protein